jgi:hypothetical protein
VKSLYCALVLTASCRGDGGDRAPRLDPPQPVAGSGSDAGGGAPPIDGGDRAALGGPPGSGGLIDPSAATGAPCPDRVAGVWIAKTFADRAGRWHEHRLAITRDSDGLHAQQTTRMWNGGPGDAFPPTCATGGPSWGIATMTDNVEFLDGILHVWGVSLDANIHTCGGSVDSYNLDSFTGRVHRNNYETFNNDGRDAVNRPYRFHRIACSEP